MTVENDFIDSMQLSQFIWNALRIKKEEKHITFQKISQKVWKSHPYINNILNGKTKWNKAVFQEIAFLLWMTKEEFNNLLEQAIYNVAWITKKDKNLFQNIPFDFVLSREFNNNKKAIKEVKSIIEFVKSKYWNKS